VVRKGNYLWSEDKGSEPKPKNLKGGKMKKVLRAVVVLILSVVSTTYGFDGNRKGFVLGGGLGFSPRSSWEGNVVDLSTFPPQIVKADENKAGLGLNLIIGYAWDEQNMIVYEGNVTGWNSDLFVDQSIAQGFNGASWYHYFGVPGRSAFTTLGLGFYVFDVKDYDANDAKGAILLGGGYEFARHWQLGGYLGIGKTSDPGGDFDHTHFSILVSGVAF